ncbi:hypothetical protein [Halorubellus salinus]|uniref:hypothetical protein n=1 Tax=Halorubellus salinus TaxID=755309 RepID=UPI001D06F9D3|nr:hypothetical protein [Halorubellus salinus]
MRGEIVTPHLYICPEDADGYENCCYAVGNTKSNSVFVAVVDAEKAVNLIDNSRHTMVDGSIVYVNLDDEDWEDLFVEARVGDVDPDELSCHPY